AAKKLLLYYTHFLELTELHSSLDSYSVCERHYNQIIVTNNLYNILEGLAEESKRTQLDANQDNLTDSYTVLTAKFGKAMKHLEFIQTEVQQKSQLITDLENRIGRMQLYIEEQKNEIETLKSKLQRAHDSIIEVRNLYDEKSKHNEALIKQWNLRFSTQQKHIDAVIEIAKTGKLSRRNQVIVKFIETLVQNQDSDILSQKKLFKTATTIDLICRACHGKYVSEIQLALSAIKYLIARSRIIINIDNHITNSGSEYQFQKWIEELSQHEEPLPEGLLFLAFDNEQRGQRNYLDQGFNTVVYHVITSLVSFNIVLQNKIQHINLPWTCGRLQYEELFDVNPQITRLPTLAEMQKEKIIEDKITDKLAYPLVFRPYRASNEPSVTYVSKISLTQQTADPRVNVPKIYVPDLININPNSIANVEKVLLHIEVISVSLVDSYPRATTRRNEHASSVRGVKLSHSNLSVEGYLAWVKEQKDSLYQIKYEQTFVYLQVIINYRKAIRTNNPLLKKAARKFFSPIWSARCHPIYRLIEATDKVQLMQLRLEIQEVNKTLKTLIPPVLQHYHWTIAARNCKKFIELQSNLFKVIRYNDRQTFGPRTRPELTLECRRFRIQLRSLDFVNQGLEEYDLNEHLKNFISLAKKARQDFITEVFINGNNSPSFRPILITNQEAKMVESEKNMTKAEILLKVEIFLEQLDETFQKRYSGLKSKKKGELLDILQEVRRSFIVNEVNNQNDLEIQEYNTL
ncbi:6224_t:CDS:2, partial [Scutellospora calospora]